MRQANPPVAILFMLTATAFIAGTMMLAKLLGGNYLGPALHPFQITHGRFVFAFATISTALAVLRPAFGKIHWPLHLDRTAFGACGVTCMFAAVAFIPLPDASAISFLNPVFGMLLAIPFLGERVGPWRWFAACMAFIGAVILLRPGTGTLEVGGLIALASATFLGAELIFIKKLSNVENPLQILFVNNALGVGIATLAVLPVWVMPTSAQWAALIALGVLMACAQTCFVNAIARAEASFITPFSYMTLLFATLYDFLVFDIVPNAISWTGAAIIGRGRDDFGVARTHSTKEPCMNLLTIYRPRKVVIRQLVNLILMVGVSAYLLISYQTSGWTYDIMMGSIFTVWSCFILWHFLTRGISFQEVNDGFKVHNKFKFRHFRWADLVAMGDPEASQRIIFLVYRPEGAEKDRYLGISRRMLGDDGYAAVLQLIKSKRPDLLLFADGQVQPSAG